MHHYDLTDKLAHHWQGYTNQPAILADIWGWSFAQSPDVHIDNITFGLDDNHHWYATAYCAGKLPDGSKN